MSPRWVAARESIASNQRLTLGKSAYAWPWRSIKRVQGNVAMSAIE
ncbi:MAG: hypothetical protein ACKOEE_04310 [Tagaea sp.]